MAQNSNSKKARKDGQGSKWLRPTTRTRLEMRAGYTCCYCGCKVRPSNGIPHPQDSTIDHVLAAELGGTNAPSNLVCCCQRCNSAKGKKSLPEFIAYLKAVGADTDGMARRIRNETRRKLPALPAGISADKAIKAYRRQLRAEMLEAA